MHTKKQENISSTCYATNTLHSKYIFTRIIHEELNEKQPTLKKEFVEPQQYVPYFIFVCFERSSAELTGDDILELVKKAELCLLSNLSEYFVCVRDKITGEISSVGGHHDQREEPPHNGHCPS